MTSSNTNELKRLNFEDALWIIFAILCFLNVFGDYLEKEYLKTDINNYDKQSNEVFTFTLIVTLFIYIYFFLRNYNIYKNVSQQQKSLYSIKVMGSVFLIAGVICLLYFQKNNKSFIGSPSL